MGIPLSAWTTEPDTVDEREFTPWAEPGWRAWNAMSPEMAFCEWAQMLVVMSGATLTIETGVGQGFTSRRVAGVMRDHTRLLTFESDDVLRSELKELPFYDSSRHQIARDPLPSRSEFSRADLTILDSDPPWRFQELTDWAAAAKPGACLLIHDAGNGHPKGSPHHEIRHQIKKHDLHGRFLANPRGAFLAFR